MNLIVKIVFLQGYQARASLGLGNVDDISQRKLEIGATIHGKIEHLLSCAGVFNAQTGIVRKNKRTRTQCMGTDGGHSEALAAGLQNGAAGRK